MINLPCVAVAFVASTEGLRCESSLGFSFSLIISCTSVGANGRNIGVVLT